MSRHASRSRPRQLPRPPLLTDVEDRLWLRLRCSVGQALACAGLQSRNWIIQFLVLLFGYTTIGWTYVVPTGSMENTVMTGDHLIVDHLVYGQPGPVSKYILPHAEVQRGDIIVFRYPVNPAENYVKRVIGVPGDRIQLRGKQLYVNGARVAEPYLNLIAGGGTPYMNDFPRRHPDIPLHPRALAMLRSHVREGELIVPSGQYFALGDNRDASADSRFWGLVPRGNIIGKPVIVWWSYEATTEQLRNRSHYLDAARHFFTKTRWERMFRPVRGTRI